MLKSIEKNIITPLTELKDIMCICPEGHISNRIYLSYYLSDSELNKRILPNIKAGYYYKCLICEKAYFEDDWKILTPNTH
jgi:hypothetical protein